MIIELKQKAKNRNALSMMIVLELKKGNQTLLDEIESSTYFLKEYYKTISLHQRLYHIWEGIDTIEVCPYCGKPKGIEKRLSRCGNFHNFRKYTATCGSKGCITKNKRDTCFKNFGVEYPMQSAIVRDKAKDTWMINFGVSNPMQSENIFHKYNPYYKKYYTLPSGKIIKIQGYEHFFLNNYFSIGGIEENVQYEKIESVSYVLNGVKHFYYPDFYLKNENKVIEVKSEWTFEKDLKKNLSKQRACIEQGFDFEFFIYDRKGNRI